jgi:hypothetical protein
MNDRDGMNPFQKAKLKNISLSVLCLSLSPLYLIFGTKVSATNLFSFY